MKEIENYLKWTRERERERETDRQTDRQTDVKQIRNKYRSKQHTHTHTHIYIGWLVAFYGISTFVGYLMPNLFLYK